MTTITTRCPVCHKLNRVPTARLANHPMCGHCQHALLDSGPIEGTAENLSHLLNSSQPVVVDFWAPWCNPCVGFAPVFRAVSQKMAGSVRFIKVDTEAQQQLAAQYHIRSIPTLMVFKHGTQVDMINGALPETQFIQWLNQAITK